MLVFFKNYNYNESGKKEIEKKEIQREREIRLFLLD